MELAFNIGLSVTFLFINFLMSYYICREARKAIAKRLSEDDQLTELKVEIAEQKQRMADEEEAQIKKAMLEKAKQLELFQKILKEEWKKICTNNEVLIQEQKQKFQAYAAQAADKMKKNLFRQNEQN